MTRDGMDHVGQLEVNMSSVMDLAVRTHHRLVDLERNTLPREAIFMLVAAMIPDAVTALVRQTVAEIVRRHEEEAHQGANAS